MGIGLHGEEFCQVVLVVDSNFAFVTHGHGQVDALAGAVHGDGHCLASQVRNPLEVLVKVGKRFSIQCDEGVALGHSGLFGGAARRKFFDDVGHARKHPRRLFFDGLGHKRLGNGQIHALAIAEHSKARPRAEQHFDADFVKARDFASVHCDRNVA